MSDDRRVVVDLSHEVTDGMTTHPGLPGPSVVDHLSREDSRGRYADGVEFQIGRITMVASTGTYLDAPFHRYADGDDVARLPLSRLVDVPGLVVRATAADGAEARGVGPEAFDGVDVAGRAVLVHTGWDRHWGTERYGDSAHPYLTAEAVDRLVGQAPALVGIDAVNIDDHGAPARPAHSRLLAAGIPILENLRGLDRLPDEGFVLHAAPVAVAGMGSFPVRVYALLGR